jgi:hypothetical protein
MEPAEDASPWAFRKGEKFLDITVSVAAAAIATDALVKKSLRLSSVDAFSALSAMVAS